MVHKFVDQLLVAFIPFSSPHQPKLENVVVSSALYHLVASVVRDVIRLVLLEEIVGTHAVAVNKETLQKATSIISLITAFFLYTEKMIMKAA